MIEKISIFILICNLNFIANFPIEDFSFDYNKSEANESKDVVVHKGAVDVNFELIHENDENGKVIKSKFEATSEVNLEKKFSKVQKMVFTYFKFGKKIKIKIIFRGVQIPLNPWVHPSDV